VFFVFFDVVCVFLIFDVLFVCFLIVFCFFERVCAGFLLCFFFFCFFVVFVLLVFDCFVVSVVFIGCFLFC